MQNYVSVTPRTIFATFNYLLIISYFCSTVKTTRHRDIVPRFTLNRLRSTDRGQESMRPNTLCLRCNPSKCKHRYERLRGGRNMRDTGVSTVPLFVGVESVRKTKGAFGFRITKDLVYLVTVFDEEFDVRGIG